MAFFPGNYGGIAKLRVISRNLGSLNTLSPQNIHTQFLQKCSVVHGKRKFPSQNTSGFLQSYGRSGPQPKALRVMAATDEGGTADDKELQELRDLYEKKDSQRLEQRDARNKTFKEIQDISLAITAAGSGEEAARKMLQKRKLERKLDSVAKKLKQINKEVRAIRAQKEQLEKQKKAKKKSKNSRAVDDDQESESDLQTSEVEVMEAAMGIIYSSLLTQRSVQEVTSDSLEHFDDEGEEEEAEEDDEAQIDESAEDARWTKFEQYVEDETEHQFENESSKRKILTVADVIDMDMLPPDSSILATDIVRS